MISFVDINVVYLQCIESSDCQETWYIIQYRTMVYIKTAIHFTTSWYRIRIPSEIQYKAHRNGVKIRWVRS